MLDLSTMSFVAEWHPRKINLRNPGADKSYIFAAFWGEGDWFSFFFKAEQCWEYFARLFGKQFLFGFMKNNEIQIASLKDIQ